MLKKWLIILLAVLLLFSGCEYTGDGDAGYTPQDEYVLPLLAEQEKGSVPYVVAKLVAMGQVVRDYNELKADGIGAMEAYSIRTNGITVELYRFEKGHKLLEKTKELGAYPILDEKGEVLSTKRAAVNGNVVMMLPADKNKNLEDITAMNDKLIKRFLSIDLA